MQKSTKNKMYSVLLCLSGLAVAGGFGPLVYYKGKNIRDQSLKVEPKLGKLEKSLTERLKRDDININYMTEIKKEFEIINKDLDCHIRLQKKCQESVDNVKKSIDIYLQNDQDKFLARQSALVALETARDLRNDQNERLSGGMLSAYFPAIFPLLIGGSLFWAGINNYRRKEEKEESKV